MTSIATALAVVSWAAMAAAWLCERRQSKEWQIVCVVLGNEYDRIQTQMYNINARSSGLSNVKDRITN